MTFEAFDMDRIDEYAAAAKVSWGSSPEWGEYERRSAGRTSGEERAMGEELMGLFVPLGRMAAEGADPADADALAQAAHIQDYISEHFYACSDEVFLQLGHLYGDGGDFTQNIDAVAGEGAGAFAERAIEALVGGRRVGAPSVREPVA